ncbi:MAG: hypothetical protein ACXWGV_03860 [Solirubrobacterales bacterium]
MGRRSLVAAALALAATASCFAGSASATPVFSLRVEAPGRTVDPGTWYAHRSPIAAQRGELQGSGNCVSAGGDISLTGRTALGLLASAANANGGLRPVLVAEDSFGRRVCRVAGFNETDTPFTGWLYRVNHASPTPAADLFAIDKDDEVLWVFAGFPDGPNSGDELLLNAPFRATPGTLQVAVTAFDFNGVGKSAPDGTVISGGKAPVTTAGGTATVPVAAGRTVLRATGPGAAPTEIPSNQVPLCVAVQLSDCPAAPGRRIVGSNARDVIKGTPGPDAIRTRGGKDVVRVRGGGADFVNCGKAKDKVLADASDTVRRCEKGKRS